MNTAAMCEFESATVEETIQYNLSTYKAKKEALKYWNVNFQQAFHHFTFSL